MTNDEIRGMIARFEHEIGLTMKEYERESDRNRSNELYGRVRGIEYAIGALEACIRDE